MEKVSILLSDCFDKQRLIIEESTPPDRKAPSETSETLRELTLSSTNFLTFFLAL